MNSNGQKLWRNRLLSIALLLAIFIAGVIVGLGVQSWERPSHPPAPRPPLGMPGPIPGLDLTDDQQQIAHAIAERHRPKLEAIMHGVFPQVRAINEQMEKELRAILTPEQQRELDEFKRHHPPPPPRHEPRPRPQ